MKYSQNNEEAVIASYFGDFVGTLLSLGENDGETLSNSRALIKKGWRADLVEPAPGVFEKLFHLYSVNESVRTHNVAIGNEDGKGLLFDSGSLLNQGDRSLVSTLSKVETARWGSMTFVDVVVDVITIQTLLTRAINKNFDFVSIDCEGFDLDILRQMDLNFMGVKCVCVEFNGKDEDLYFAHVKKFGFTRIHKNAENLIYAR